jgi:NitT/TauT family transport system ATP-binding protein
LAILELKHLRKEFDKGSAGKLLLFNDISFKMEENENFLSILAPFGSGKSTLLKIISGMENYSSGEILLNNKNFRLEDKKVVLIPEKPSSFPWLNVKENLELIDKKGPVDNIIKLIGLEDYAGHFPDNKSIGFRFRISLGRVLLLNPLLILIDDSLKGMDPVTKQEIYELLKNISHSTGVKFIIATTNISTAAELSDRIIVFSGAPVKIASEFKIKSNTNEEFLQLVTSIEKIFLNDRLTNSINFTI